MRHLYTRFVGVATADGTLNACAPLVDWLRAAITRQTANDVSLLETPYPTVPLADAALIDHRWAIASRDLPMPSTSVAKIMQIEDVDAVEHIISQVLSSEDDILQEGSELMTTAYLDELAKDGLWCFLPASASLSLRRWL